MLDPKFIREHQDAVRRNIVNRGVSVDFERWLGLDAERLSLLQGIERQRAERNAVAGKMAAASPADRPSLIEQGKKLKEELASAEEAFKTVDSPWQAILLTIPNMAHPEAPFGLTDADNAELRIVGEVRKIENPKDHVALCEMHDWVDFERAAKVSGAKFYYLKNDLVLLEQALVRFALETLKKEGFTLLQTPDLAKDEVIVGTGFAPRGNETQIYSIENSDLSLVGTAEITVGGYHKDEILDAEKLPLKYAGLSHCYRTEAGAYGKESYGLYRVHQFTKVEMFAFTTPEQSEAVHRDLLRVEEYIFQQLEIPYRVINICVGDLGGPAYRKYDLEAWMWGRESGKGGWGEVTSASNCTDYQARRLNIRTKNAEGTSVFAHTLNGTAISLCRAMIAFLENHQQPDGSIRIPKALVPYFGAERMG